MLKCWKQHDNFDQQVVRKDLLTEILWILEKTKTLEFSQADEHPVTGDYASNGCHHQKIAEMAHSHG
ncbi:hypothetical protein P3S68_027436 [Capsicum galapagoense]